MSWSSHPEAKNTHDNEKKSEHNALALCVLQEACEETEKSWKLSRRLPSELTNIVHEYDQSFFPIVHLEPKRKRRTQYDEVWGDTFAFNGYTTHNDQRAFIVVPSNFFVEYLEYIQELPFNSARLQHERNFCKLARFVNNDFDDEDCECPFHVALGCFYHCGMDDLCLECENMFCSGCKMKNKDVIISSEEVCYGCITQETTSVDAALLQTLEWVLANTTIREETESIQEYVTLLKALNQIAEAQKAIQSIDFKTPGLKKMFQDITKGRNEPVLVSWKKYFFHLLRRAQAHQSTKIMQQHQASKKSKTAHGQQ
jgi:hypothetical protein